MLTDRTTVRQPFTRSYTDSWLQGGCALPTALGSTQARRIRWPLGHAGGGRTIPGGYGIGRTVGGGGLESQVGGKQHRDIDRVVVHGCAHAGMIVIGENHIVPVG